MTSGFIIELTTMQTKKLASKVYRERPSVKKLETSFQ